MFQFDLELVKCYIYYQKASSEIGQNYNFLIILLDRKGKVNEYFWKYLMSIKVLIFSFQIAEFNIA